MTDVINNREVAIDRLARSFEAMPRWAQIACKHAMCAPTINPATGVPFETFREVLETADDDTLINLLNDFADNGDLLD